ncbi:hypothetical protein KCU93_g438, partial [Aureobasidium melanogenum]
MEASLFLGALWTYPERHSLDTSMLLVVSEERLRELYSRRGLNNWDKSDIARFERRHPAITTLHSLIQTFGLVVKTSRLYCDYRSRRLKGSRSKWLPVRARARKQRINSSVMLASFNLEFVAEDVLEHRSHHCIFCCFSNQDHILDALRIEHALVIWWLDSLCQSMLHCGMSLRFGDVAVATEGAVMISSESIVRTNISVAPVIADSLDIVCLGRSCCGKKISIQRSDWASGVDDGDFPGHSDETWSRTVCN